MRGNLQSVLPFFSSWTGMISRSSFWDTSISATTNSSQASTMNYSPQKYSNREASESSNAEVSRYHSFPKNSAKQMVPSFKHLPLSSQVRKNMHHHLAMAQKLGLFSVIFLRPKALKHGRCFGARCFCFSAHATPKWRCFSSQESSRSAMTWIWWSRKWPGRASIAMIQTWQWFKCGLDFLILDDGLFAVEFMYYTWTV